MGARGVSRKNEVTEAQAATFHRLRITLEGIEPPIWREIQIASDATFDILHHALQICMGWQESHMHQFLMKDLRIGRVGDFDEPDEFEDGLHDQSITFLGDVLKKPKDACVYEYDFGDGWSHWVQTEAIEPRNGSRDLVVCLAGARACPPEDCGGVSGYEDLLAAFKKKRRTADEQARVDWAGDFDPEAFSVEQVNRALKRQVKPVSARPKAKPRQVAR